MKNHIISAIIFLTLISIVIAKGQGHSSMYHNNGQLKVDTTLKINQKQLQKWISAERYIMIHLTRNPIYTSLAKENGVEGLSIIAFEYESPTIKNIRIIKKVGAGLDESIVNEITKYSNRISQELNYDGNKENNDSTYNGTYYLPFAFSVIDLITTMEVNNAIPIIEVGTPLVTRCH